MRNNKEIEDIVQQIIKELNRKGIKVEAASTLKINEDKKENKPFDFEDILEKIKGLKKLDTFNKAEDLQKEFVKKCNESSDPEECYCPNCFNFESFEKKLSKRKGTFDYKSVTLNGKEFDIKYWTDGVDENLMISPKEDPKPTNTLEELQTQLKESVSNKEYDKAQSLIDLINKIKNQKEKGDR